MSDVSRRRLVEAATHELHTPLTAILGYQELLADGVYGELAEPAREAVIRIGRSAQHLMSLIDGLLDAILVEADDLELDLEDVFLGDVVGAAVEATRDLADDRGFSVQVALPAGVRPLRTDPVRLRRSLELILITLIRYAETATGLEIGGEPGDAVRLTFGPARLTPDMLRPDPSVRASSDRLSLRLAVAQRVLAALGGGLELAPADGLSHVVVHLPAAAPERASPD